ncbi:MAG: NPCBM/NEW2 domain-containing protein [Anaerolineae bacterium]
MEHKSILLGELDLSDIQMGWPIPPHVDKTVKGEALSVGGREFAHGVWMNANCRIDIALDGRGFRFTGLCGPDDITAGSYPSTMEFQVLCDGTMAFRSGVMTVGMQAQAVEVELQGVETLSLVLDSVDGNVGNAQGDWIEPVISYVGGQPPFVRYPEARQDDDNPAPTDGYKAFHPGKSWYDTDGVKIQAHGGGLLKVDDTWYWFGEHKGGPTTWWPKARVDVIGVSCYRSRDLLNWENMGLALPAVPDAPSSPLHPDNVLERPKVLYCANTGQYVMWVKSEDAGYTWGHALVATSDRPEGPYAVRNSFRPAGMKFGDFALHENDGVGYLIWCGGDGETTRIYRLSATCTSLADPVAEFYEGAKREAPALLQRPEGYYLITSGKSGWSPNPTRYAFAESLAGPWEDRGELFHGEGSHNSFRSQPTFVLEYHGRIIYMGDRWNQRDLGDSRYVWLPLTLARGALRGEWMDSWSLYT